MASRSPKLKVGLLLPGNTLSRAAAKVIEDLLASDAVRIELVLFQPVTGASAAARNRSPNPGVSLGRRLSGVGWDVCTRLDRRRVRLVDDPLSPRDCTALLDGISSLELPQPATGVDGRPSASMNRLTAANLDVIVHLGSAGPRLENDPRADLGLDPLIRDAAGYGVWALRFGDPERYPDGPFGFWEMVDDDPVTTVRLERLPGTASGGVVLCTAAFPTDSGSLARNRVQPLYGSSHLVIVKLEQLHAFGWDWVARGADPLPAVHGRRLRGRPGAWALARWLGPRMLRTVITRLGRAILRRSPTWQWRIAIRSAADGSLLDRAQDMTGFRWVVPPPGHVYADPFLLTWDGRTWLFIEDLATSVGRGVISAAEVETDGRLSRSAVVLTSAGHLSYPYVFVEGGTPYMIPETASENVVRLYRATDFPSGWEVDAELYQRAALDTSAWWQDDRWWFFTTVREPRGNAIVLLLFFADSLRGPWTSHPRNPISMDVRNCRGAGAIFRDNGRLVRPSQDSSRTYGYSFTLYEIVKLSTEDYEERPISSVRPDWDPDIHATHTYNHAGSIEVTDGKFRVAGPAAG